MACWEVCAVAGSGDTPHHPMSPALTFPDPQLLLEEVQTFTPSHPRATKPSGNGPKGWKWPKPHQVQPWPPSPRCGMCFLWNLGASQGGDAGSGLGEGCARSCAVTEPFPPWFCLIACQPPAAGRAGGAAAPIFQEGALEGRFCWRSRAAHEMCCTCSF